MTSEFLSKTEKSIQSNLLHRYCQLAFNSIIIVNLLLSQSSTSVHLNFIISQSDTSFSRNHQYLSCSIPQQCQSGRVFVQ